MFSTVSPCACDIIGKDFKGTGPSTDFCDKTILSREEEVVLTAMRSLRLKARDLKEELGRIEGKELLIVRQQYLKMVLASYREQFHSYQEKLQQANQQKHIRLGHLDPWDI